MRSFASYDTVCCAGMTGGKHAPVIRNILNNISTSNKEEFFICINSNEWEHHFEPQNYRRINTITEKDVEMISSMPFLKIASKIPISQFDVLEESLCKNYDSLLRLLY